MSETVRDRLVLEIGSKVESSAVDGSNFIKGIVGAAAAAIAALAGLTVYIASTGDAAAKGARGVDQSVESYQRLSIAAEFAGVAVQDLFAGVGAGNERLGAAATGNEGLAEAFKKVGINAKEAVANGQSFADLLPQVLDGMKGLSQAERSFYGGQLIGGEVVRKIASMVEGGSEGLQAAFAEADKSRAVMSRAQTDAAEALTDTFTSVQLRATGLAVTLGARLVPAVDRLITSAIDLFDRFSPTIFDAVDAAGQVLADTLDALSLPFVQITIGATVLAGALYGLSLALGVLATSAWASSAAWSWFAVAFTAASVTEFAAAATIGFVELGAAIWAATAPLLPWVAAILIAALAVDDLLTYMDGGDSLFGRWTDALSPGSGVHLALSSFGELVTAVADLVGAGMGAMWDSASALFSGLTASARDMVSGLGPDFDWLLGWLDTLTGAFDKFTAALGKIPQNFARGASFLTEVAGAGADRLRGDEVFTAEEQQVYGSAREALAARANARLNERGQELAANREQRQANTQPAATPTVIVNPAPQMSEEQIGRAAARELTRQRRAGSEMSP